MVPCPPSLILEPLGHPSGPWHKFEQPEVCLNLQWLPRAAKWPQQPRGISQEKEAPATPCSAATPPKLVVSRSGGVYELLQLLYATHRIPLLQPDLPPLLLFCRGGVAQLEKWGSYHMYNKTYWDCYKNCRRWEVTRCSMKFWDQLKKPVLPTLKKLVGVVQTTLCISYEP